MHTTCLTCNKPLSDPRSMREGYGPECRAAKKRKIEEDQGVDPLFTFLFDQASNPDVVLRRGANGEAMSNIRQTIARHSPTGLEWGYAGSGPADLALNILLRHGLPLHDADRLYQPFKENFLATMPEEGGIIPARKIKAWIKTQKKGKGTSPAASRNSKVYPDQCRSKDSTYARA